MLILVLPAHTILPDGRLLIEGFPSNGVWLEPEDFVILAQDNGDVIIGVPELAQLPQCPYRHITAKGLMCITPKWTVPLYIGIDDGTINCVWCFLYSPLYPK